MQQQQDLVEQEEWDRVACDTEEACKAQQEAEAKEVRKETDKKKPKLKSFSQE